MSLRFPASLLLCVGTLLAGSAEVHALHPDEFPHQHAQQAGPSSEEAPPQSAPVPTPKGNPAIYSGVGIAGTMVIPTGSAMSHGLGEGIGFELFLGWRLNQWAAVDIEWFTTFHDTEGSDEFSIEAAVLSGFCGLVRVYFIEPGLFEPFLGIGVSFVSANGGPQSEISLIGPGFSGGAGFDLNFNDEVGLGVKVLYRGSFLDNRSDRRDHLPEFPAEAGFISLLSFSTHVRLNF